MTDPNTNQDASGKALAQHIAEVIKGHPHAEIRVNPNVQAAIPPNIANNLLEFMRRVSVVGMEALAWAEAYSYVQQHAPQPPRGVPFSGLPKKPE